MSDETTDVVQTAEGGQETPTPAPSTPEGGQDSPGTESPVEALSQDVKELTGMVRALQSEKDSRIAGIQRQVTDNSEQLKTYHERVKSGMTHDEALREDVLDQVAAQYQPPGATQVSPPAEAAPQPQVTSDEILAPYLKIAGLEQNDPDVIEILRAERDQSQQFLKIAELGQQRKQAPATPLSPGAVMPTGGGEAVTSETMESLTAQLAELQNLPVQTDASRKERKEINAQLANLK